MEEVILVDSKNRRTGVGEKLEIHKKGLLHRAFSIFIFNQKGELLLQRRALSKYHSGGLWSNTCCGHPRPQERVLRAAHRRLGEEMRLDCHLDITGIITYKARVGNLMENEIDYVLVGKIKEIEINPNPDEACDYSWIKLDDLKNNIKIEPEKYTHWFKLILDKKISALLET